MDVPKSSPCPELFDEFDAPVGGAGTRATPMPFSPTFKAAILPSTADVEPVDRQVVPIS